jgi:thiol:disulfide interchange protein
VNTVQKVTLLVVVVAAVAGGIALSRGKGQAPTSAPASAAAGATEAIAWQTSLPEAQAEAKRRKALIVVDAYADWCHWCKKMDEDTFTSAEVQQRMKQFVPLRLNTDANPSVAQRYGIQGLPTTLVLDANGNVKASQPGYLQPREYLQLLGQFAR